MVWWVPLDYTGLIPNHEGQESAWLTLFTHLPNDSKGHMAEFKLCTNMMLNSSCEQPKLS